MGPFFVGLSGRVFLPLRERDLNHSSPPSNIFMKSILLLMVAVILVGSTDELMALDEIDIYLGGYAQGSMPLDSNKDIRVHGRTVQQSSIGGGLGGGVKIGLFHDVTKRILGIELEYGGTGGDIRVQPIGRQGESTSDLVTLHSMVNLIVRYPHKQIRPYVGVGVGSSSGLLINAKVEGRKNKNVESAIAFGHQYFAGLHMNVSEKIFLFGEFKYIRAKYHWKKFSVDYRSQSVVGGIGYQF
ncbi:outer membrane beta-barrel protein [Nitrospira sp. M1]